MVSFLETWLLVTTWLSKGEEGSIILEATIGKILSPIHSTDNYLEVIKCVPLQLDTKEDKMLSNNLQFSWRNTGDL